MINTIKATITKKHQFICNVNTIGRAGENGCNELEMILDEVLYNCWVYLDFISPDGNKYKTPKLDIVDNTVNYAIPNSLLCKKGILKVQMVAQNEEGIIWATDVKEFYVRESINAVDEIENKEDFITEAQRLLDEVEEGLTPTIGENDNWFICGKDTGKTSRGIQGEKGEKGDAGSVRFIVANELPTENINDGAIYMIPAGAISEGNTYEEYIYVNEQWESLGSASVNVDLADYVKITDYATKETAGVVKVNNSYGIQLSATSNTLQITSATKDVIDNKSSSFRPITPYLLNYAVGSVLPVMTQAEYDALTTKDEELYYFIVEE